MELFIREIGKVLFGWWWFCEDGQTKTADFADRYIVLALVALALGCITALAMWKLL